MPLDDVVDRRGRSRSWSSWARPSDRLTAKGIAYHWGVSMAWKGMIGASIEEEGIEGRRCEENRSGQNRFLT